MRLPTFKLDFLSRTQVKKDRTVEKFPAGSYVMDNGNMYHLANPWGTIYATMWCLTEPDANSSAPKMFNINGVVDSAVTSIGGVEFDNGAAGNDKVFNLSGQCVGNGADIDRLPKGLYITNGKKVVK